MLAGRRAPDFGALGAPKEWQRGIGLALSVGLRWRHVDGKLPCDDPDPEPPSVSEPMNFTLPNRRYRFGFVLNTTLGNMTRYANLRKYAERDQEIDFTWAPVNHYTAPDFPSSLRFLPDPLFMRARVLQQASPVLSRLGSFDAVMFHLYEADLISAARR